MNGVRLGETAAGVKEAGPRPTRALRYCASSSLLRIERITWGIDMHSRSVFGSLVLVAYCCLTVIAFGQGKIGYSETKAIFAGNTAVSYDRGHGTQVEFISTNGKTYLFYPNNTVVVKGEWKLERTDQPDVFSICFRYPTNSHNPVTGQAGGNWECQIAGFYFAALEELVQGDPLGLSRRSEVPFVLSPAKTTIAQLLRKLPQ